MSTEFEYLKTIAYYFTLVPPDRRLNMLADLIRLLRPPRELLQRIVDEMPPTPAPQSPPPEQPEPRRVVIGTIYK
jgi:hypothetical protein